MSNNEVEHLNISKCEFSAWCEWKKERIESLQSQLASSQEQIKDLEFKLSQAMSCTKQERIEKLEGALKELLSACDMIRLVDEEGTRRMNNEYWDWKRQEAEKALGSHE